MANEIGKPKSNAPWPSPEIRRKWQHHPGAKQRGLTGFSGVDSYTLSIQNKKYGGYGVQSLGDYRANVVKRSECMNPVQGILGKRARLKRDQGS